MRLRPFNNSDSQSIEQLFIKTFTDSDGPTEGERVGRLVKRLINEAETHHVLGFVAIENETVVGCIFFTPLIFDTPIRAALLSPVAVSTDHQGLGIGQQLIQFGLDELRVRGEELVFTYGDPNYYSKVGFKAVPEKTAKAPFALSQPEGWLGQSLTTVAIEPLPGYARCVAAFNEPDLW